jgi:hypothetical protein
LGPLGKQQPPRTFERNRAAFLLRQALPNY